MTTLNLQDCETLLAAAIEKGICKGDADAARRYLDAGDVEGFERICRGNDALFEVMGVPYVLTDGTAERWHDNGQLKATYFYVNGKLRGKYLWRYDNGQMREQSNYVEGEMHGKSTRWHDNGQVREKANYVNGQMHGQSTWWYDNGQMRQKSNYINGEMHGQSTWWDEDGQVCKQSTYINGVKQL
jgi:antitoxin component YwqK of YwqJK toxin-antitoxin module